MKFKKWDVSVWVGFKWFRVGSSDGFYEDCSKPLCSMKVWIFCQLSNYQFSEADPASDFGWLG